MAKKRKISKRKKAKRGSIASAGKATIDVGKAAIALAQRIKELRAELRALKKSMKTRRKKRR